MNLGIKMDYKEKYRDKWCNRVKDFILSLDVNVEDVYVISFLKGNEDDDPRYPYVIVDYNTISNCKSQISKASSEGEAKWNYAFWLENDLLTIGGENDSDLKELFKSLNLFYGGDNSYDDLLDEDLEDDEKDDRMQELFMDIVMDISNRLHKDGIIKEKFGKEIPVIIHELEYYELPMSWTRKGNPKELISEFEEWYKTEICRN